MNNIAVLMEYQYFIKKKGYCQNTDLMEGEYLKALHEYAKISLEVQGHLIAEFHLKIAKGNMPIELIESAASISKVFKKTLLGYPDFWKLKIFRLGLLESFQLHFSTIRENRELMNTINMAVGTAEASDEEIRSCLIFLIQDFIHSNLRLNAYLSDIEGITNIQKNNIVSPSALNPQKE